MKLRDRVKTYNFWVSLASAIFLILSTIGQKFNFYVDEGVFGDIFTAICSILVLLGIIVPPTKKTNFVLEDLSEDPSSDENLAQSPNDDNLNNSSCAGASAEEADENTDIISDAADTENTTGEVPNSEQNLDETNAAFCSEPNGSEQVSETAFCTEPNGSEQMSETAFCTEPNSSEQMSEDNCNSPEFFQATFFEGHSVPQGESTQTVCHDGSTNSGVSDTLSTPATEPATQVESSTTQPTTAQSESPDPAQPTPPQEAPNQTAAEPAAQVESSTAQPTTAQGESHEPTQPTPPQETTAQADNPISNAGSQMALTKEFLVKLLREGEIQYSSNIELYRQLLSDEISRLR